MDGRHPALEDVDVSPRGHGVSLGGQAACALVLQLGLQGCSPPEAVLPRFDEL